jgi:hypothetical protein
MSVKGILTSTYVMAYIQQNTTSRIRRHTRGTRIRWDRSGRDAELSSSNARLCIGFENVAVYRFTLVQNICIHRQHQQGTKNPR